MPSMSSSSTGVEDFLTREEFYERLKAETEEIRKAHDSAMQAERQAWQVQLEANGGRVEVREEESCNDRARLQHEIARYLRQAECQETPYSAAAVASISELLSSIQALQTHCNRKYSMMFANFCPKGLNGKEYPLSVHPAAETVQEVKRRLRQLYCKTCEVKLCTSDGHVMEDSKKLMEFDLDQEFSLILVDVLRDQQLLQLSFDPQNLPHEAVSGHPCTILNDQHVKAVEKNGRIGVNITETGCLILPEPVKLQDKGWTISTWIWAPLEASPHKRHLLDGKNAMDFVVVAISRGRLVNWNGGNFLRGFNISSLAEGWHHLVIVSHAIHTFGLAGEDANKTSFYLNGKKLGSKSGAASGTVCVVGNSKGDTKAWGHLSDLQIFDMPADLLHIEGLYQQGGGVIERDASWETENPTENARDRWSDESISSYSSLQSYMESYDSETESDWTG